MRRNYTIVLDITPTAPLTHGSGSEGNEQVLLRRPVNVRVDGEWETLFLPAVSGAALKATLREHAVTDYLERAGVPDGGVSRDTLRLLLKGGKNDSGGQTVSLAEQRRLRDLCPLLAVFGSMDGGAAMPAAIRVSDVTVWCAEAVGAGLLPRVVTPLQVAVDGRTLVDAPPIHVHGGAEPIPLTMATDRVTNYRHDLTMSGAARYLAAPDTARIEDARVAVAEAKRTKGAPKPDAKERREANEAMPHSAQVIVPGTPMVAIVRLQGATDVEFGALGVALVRWVRSGGHLGGGATKGHGACTVKVAGAIRHDTPTGSLPVEGGEPLPALTVDMDPAILARAYDAHLVARAEAIRAWVAA